MAHKVSAVLPSGSAPDLRRSRLEKLLTKQAARSTPAPSEISRASSVRRAPPGGAPYVAAPPVRLPTGASKRSSAHGRLASAGSEALGAPESSLPALAPQHPTESSSRLPTGASQKVEQQVGSYIKQLVGEEGDGMLHWRLVNEMDAIDGLIQDNIEKNRAAERKARQRTVLEEQVREARKKDQDFNNSRMHWGSKIQADAAQWQEEERLRKLRQQETLRKFNEEQARHAEASRARKDAEAEEVAQLEREMAQQALDAKRRSELAEEHRKRKQQEMAKEMADAAREAAEQKVLKKQAEAEKDIAMMKAQMAVMEEQERQRAQSFQRMKDKQGKAQAQYEANAGSAQARLQREEEDRAKRYQDEKAARDEAAFQDKKKKLKQMQMDGMAFLTRQLEEQATLKAAEKEEQQRFRESSDRDAAAAFEEEKRKAVERKKKEKENADFLQQQINQKTMDKRAKEQMTVVEQAINKERLDRAKKPETLQLLAQNKLRQVGQAASRGVV